MGEKTRNEKIAEVFRSEGFNGASMSLISEATGLQKGSLYHHYPNGKADMAIAAINASSETYKAETKNAFHPSIPVRKQLEEWALSIDAFYGGGNSSCILGTMTMSGGKDACSNLIKENFENWIASLTLILSNSGIEKSIANERAFAAIERIQGALIVSSALEDTSNFRRLIEQLPDILLQNTENHHD